MKKLDPNNWKDSYKWQFEAFPFFCSAYQRISAPPKNRYYDVWNDFLNCFDNGHLVAFEPKKTLNRKGEIMLKELLSGKDDFLILFRGVHKKIRKAIENCLEVREQGNFANIDGWWPEWQGVLSEISSILFPFDFTLNDKMKEWQEEGDPIFRILSENVRVNENSFFNDAEEEAVKIRKKFKDPKEARSEFIRKFGWIQNSYLGIKKLSPIWVRDFIAEAKNHKSEKDRKRILRKYKILVETAIEGITFRDNKKKLLLIGVELMEKWLRLICRQNGWKFEELRWLSMDEVLLLLQGEKKYLVLAKKMARSKKRIGIMTEIGYTNINENFWKKVVAAQSVEMNLKEIKGLSGNKGNYIGIARVITNIKKESKNLKAGDVLVTSMTRPEYLPLMKKASAFVTDEGGITCHAAIIAREMNKPCIIGTKIATQVLKDGDLVEVDADKGIIKIIKK